MDCLSGHLSTCDTRRVWWSEGLGSSASASPHNISLWSSSSSWPQLLATIITITYQRHPWHPLGIIPCYHQKHAECRFWFQLEVFCPRPCRRPRLDHPQSSNSEPYPNSKLLNLPSQGFHHPLHHPSKIGASSNHYSNVNGSENSLWFRLLECIYEHLSPKPRGSA